MKRLIYTLMILPMAISLYSCSQKDTKTQKAVAEIDSLFIKRYTCTKDSAEYTPGGCVLIIKDDSVLFDKGYGMADISRGTHIDGNTFFNIASVSKQFTAVAVMKLYADGKLDIDKSIYDLDSSLVSLLPKAEKPFTEITLRHMMSHSSGFPDERPKYDRNFVLTATDMQSIGYMKDVDSLHFTPGTEYEYANPTFQFMYAVIEKVSGMPFEQYMKENIFTPAGMDEAVYFQAEREIPRMAHGYILRDTIGEKGGFKEYDYGEETFFATKADGGIYA
ncbi:MAG: serine hydrolase [Flavobacteriales bacterium]|nr:serine hydrolase [Flavobacteriales bacterium]